MNLMIMHLSDLHISSKGDAILGRAEHIARAAYKDLASADGVVVLITGDIAYSGKPTEYVLATTFVRDLEAKIRSERNVPVYTVMCPGNHDCDFAAGKPDVREILVDNIRKMSPDDVTDGLIEECTTVQEAYFRFRDELSPNEIAFDSKLWRSQRIRVGDYSIPMSTDRLGVGITQPFA